MHSLPSSVPHSPTQATSPLTPPDPSLFASSWDLAETCTLTEPEPMIYSEYRHKTTGFTLDLLTNNDPEQYGEISFLTPPTDHTGVAHILEHSLLGGSDAYPLPQIFPKLMEISPASLINAYTGEETTNFVFASPFAQDFFELLHVYLDAVFHPLVRHDPQAFFQEGWHYEPQETQEIQESPKFQDAQNAQNAKEAQEDQEDQEVQEDPAAQTINGVVYNEMKEVLASPMAQIDNLARAHLFSNFHQYESGGDPAAIPSLTYEHFCEVYDAWYHPANGRLFLYGQLDLARILPLVEAYLAGFGPRDQEDLPKKTPNTVRLDRQRAYAFSPNLALPTQEPEAPKALWLRTWQIKKEEIPAELLGPLTMDKSWQVGIGPDGKARPFAPDIAAENLGVAATLMAQMLSNQASSPLDVALFSAKLGTDAYFDVTDYGDEFYINLLMNQVELGPDSADLPDRLDQAFREAGDHAFTESALESFLQASRLSCVHYLNQTNRGRYYGALLSGALSRGTDPLSNLAFPTRLQALTKTLTPAFLQQIFQLFFFSSSRRNDFFLLPEGLTTLPPILEGATHLPLHPEAPAAEAPATPPAAEAPATSQADKTPTAPSAAPTTAAAMDTEAPAAPSEEALLAPWLQLDEAPYREYFVPLDWEERERGILVFPQTTHGMTYLTLLYPLDQVKSAKDLALLNVATFVYDNLDVGEETAQDFQDRARLNLGRMDLRVKLVQPLCGPAEAYLQVKLAFLKERTNQALQVFLDLRDQVHFTPPQKVAHIVTSYVANRQESIGRHAARYALDLAGQLMTPVSYLKDLLDGLHSYGDLAWIDQGLSQDPDPLLAEFKRIWTEVLQRRPILAVTSDEDGLAALYQAPNLARLSPISSPLGRLQDPLTGLGYGVLALDLIIGQDFRKIGQTPRLARGRQAAMDTNSIAFVSNLRAVLGGSPGGTPQGVIPQNLAFKDATLEAWEQMARWLPLIRLLRTSYLWTKIRDEGGAYDLGLDLNGEGLLRAYSASDPQLTATLDVFQTLADQDLLYEGLGSQLTQAIRTYLLDSARPIAIDALHNLALTYLLEGRNLEVRQAIRRGVLGASSQDIASFRETLRASAFGQNYVVIGQAEQVADAQARFSDLEDLRG